MCKISLLLQFLVAALAFPAFSEAAASVNLEDQVQQAVQLLEGAEQRFENPSREWFEETQTALHDEVARVEESFAQMDPNEAAGWREHLHWHLLEPNLRSSEYDYDELALVRRWLYSNRAGLEGPVFAEVRERMDAHLSAAFTFNQADLQQAFVEKVELARTQLAAIAAEPSDKNAVALGRTLGWLEQTRQLPAEVAAIRRLLSQPNAQITISEALTQRLLTIFDTEIDGEFPVRDVGKSPPSGLLGVRRTLRVRGTAKTVGSTSLEVVKNDDNAEIQLIFTGDVLAHCTADAGPAALHILTTGPVQAIKPVLFNITGWTLGETVTDAQVKTRLTNVTADRRIIRRIAKRQAHQPSSLSHMQRTGKQHTVEMITDNMDERVDEAVAQIRAEFERMRSSMDGAAEVVAPLSREGAVPEVLGMRSDDDRLEANVISSRPNQFGALLPYENDTIGGDLQLRVHLSFFNNSLETILGGKTLSDEFLMRYAKILQAQLPMPLMVHSRSKRWAVTTLKHRPLEIEVPEPNRLRLTMRITAVDIGDDHFDLPTVATINYDLVGNDLDEYELLRDGEVQLDTELPTVAASFLHQKLDAFFAPLLNAGGVAIPDGGVLGAMNGTQLAGLQFADDWFVVGLDIPMDVIDSVIEFQRSQADEE